MTAQRHVTDVARPGAPPNPPESPSRWPWVVALVLLPFAVSAVVVGVTGGDFRPVSDYALTEMQVRDIGRHPVLTGLYSREDWTHPGPMFFYVIAPFYWAVGRASLGMNLAALAVNALAVGGIAFLSWRRGGSAMLLCAMLGCALVMRTMGAELLYDPWNNYVVTLPYGLLLFATWALLCGDRWALPIAVVVASFLAQTHVGYVALAIPLLLLGAAWLIVPVLRRGTPREQRAPVLRMSAISAAIGALLWLPPVVDALTSDSSNLGKVWNYFRNSEEETHSLATGWRIVAGQFTWTPEWLTSKRSTFVGYGESPFKFDSSVPWLLVPVVVAAVVLWVRRRDDTAGARYLGVVVAVALALGTVSVSRTLGPALDYRLQWTWMIPVAAFVLVAWTIWQLTVRRWPDARRVLVAVTLAGIVAVTGVNVYTAATVSSPWPGDSEVLADLTPQLLDEVDPDGGQVVLTDVLSDAAWYTRGLVLQLERAGVDARVPSEREALFGDSRVVDPNEPVQARLLVAQGADLDRALEDPGLRLIARWRPEPGSDYAAAVRERQRLARRLQAGELTQDEYFARVDEILSGPPHDPIAEDLAVFAYEQPEPLDPGATNP